MKHRSGLIVALAFASVLAACGEAAVTAPKDAAAVAAPVAPALDVPRNTWLTAETLLPLGADGQVARDTDRRPYGYELIGQPAPHFKVPKVGGGEFTEETFRGKWTVVDFWGIWCGDCRRDAPFVKELAAKLEGDPTIAFLSIHTPPNATRAAEAYGQFGSVDAYFEANGGGYPTALDADASLRDAYNIRWTPSYLLIGPDLKVEAFRTDLSTGGEGSVDKAIAEIRAIVDRRAS